MLFTATLSPQWRPARPATVVSEAAITTLALAAAEATVPPTEKVLFSREVYWLSAVAINGISTAEPTSLRIYFCQESTHDL